MAITLIQATILSGLDYCSSLLIGPSASDFDPLQSIGQSDTVKFLSQITALLKPEDATYLWTRYTCGY